MKRFSLVLLILWVFVVTFHFILLKDKAFAEGLTFDGQNLWYSNYEETIFKLDPHATDNTIVQTFSWAPAPSEDQYVRWRDLAWDGSYLWAASWADESASPGTSRIYKLDSNDGSAVSSFDAPFSGHANGMAWDGNNLWIGDENDQIYEVDLSTGIVISSFSVPHIVSNNPRGLAWDGSYIWAGYQRDGTIKKHNIIDGSVIVSFDSPLGWTQNGLTYDGEYLWAAGGTARNEFGGFGDPLICQINPSTGKEIFSFSPYTTPVPEPATMLLFGAGLAGLGVFRKKLKKA